MTLDLMNELNSKSRQLSASINKLADNGRELAEAERNYKIKLNEEILNLRDKGEAVTLIQLRVHGIREVAKLRFERDVAQTLYDVGLEKVNALKLQMRIIENQIGREWGKND